MDLPLTLLARYGLRPKKSWGQCFLQDPGVVRRIVAVVAPGPDDVVVEIGAGLGTLTAELARSAGHLHAIERDRDLVRVLRAELEHQGSITIEEQNALTFDYCALGSTVKVVGNLPYQISSPLLFRLREQRHCIDEAVVMLQREVAERVAAGPGSRDYGVPSVLFQQVADVERCFVVPRQVFVPSPRVDSAVLRIRFLPTLRCPCDEARFDRLVRAAFHSRRKTLKNSLTGAWQRDAVVNAFEQTQIDSGRRAETLTVAEFAALTEALPDEASPA